MKIYEGDYVILTYPGSEYYLVKVSSIKGEVITGTVLDNINGRSGYINNGNFNIFFLYILINKVNKNTSLKDWAMVVEL